MVDLSIVIPIYNAEKYLKQCLDSILSQTFKNIEIICINDCSCDNSLEILEEYKKNPTVKVINNEKNIGPSASRNIGIVQAQGKYITFIDADDYYLDDNCFSELMQKMIENNLDLLIFNNLEYDEKKQEIIKKNNFSFYNWYEKKNLNHILSEKELLDYQFKVIPFSSSKIYLKSLLIENQIYFPEKIYYEDIAFASIVMMYCKKVMVLDKAYWVYRQNIVTSITQNIHKYFDSIAAMHTYILNYLKEKKLYNTYKITFSIFLINSIFYYFLPQINDIDKANELNTQIYNIIESLNLTKDDLNKIRKRKSFNELFVIEMYEKYVQQKPIRVNKLSIFNIPITIFVEYINYKQLLLFNFLPIYKIVYTKMNRSVHYLFNTIPWLKVKKGNIYLFMLLKIGSTRECKFFTQNYGYIMYRKNYMKNVQMTE